MNCPECSETVPNDADECPSCGASLTGGSYVGSSSGSSVIDQIADDAARAVHDVVRVMKTVQKIGDEVTDAAQSVKSKAPSAHKGSAKVWASARSLTAEHGRQGKSMRRAVESKGREVKRKVARAGRQAKSAVRSASRSARKTGRNLRRGASS
ncbi:MAG: hypothetical protein WCA77_09495 [Thermoplasmata archaeon]